eukprot:6184720-Prymnesium_polylepis.3
MATAQECIMQDECGWVEGWDFGGGLHLGDRSSAPATQPPPGAWATSTQGGYCAIGQSASAWTEQSTL